MASAIETKLYVTNFPSSATRQQLQQFFSRFGRVQECAIMWNSYAFVHYASMEEARRALEQSNGAMFLNRKLIVQLSTSRFRPQPKENVNQFQSKTLINSNPSPFPHLNHAGDPSMPLQAQQQSSSLPQPYPTELNFDTMNNFNPQHSSPLPGATNFFSTTAFRPPSPFQEINGNFYSPYSNIPIDRMTTSPLSNKFSSMMKNNTTKSDLGTAGEIPKLYCTNLPDNCKASDLQRLFSPFGHVVDCVILWDYYAFITFQNFAEAERALAALHGYNWQDRRLIVEWSRASGRRQQQPGQTVPSPPTSAFSSFVSTPSSPRPRPTTLITPSSNGQFFGNHSPKLLSPMKSQSVHHSTFNTNLSMMSMLPSNVLHHHHHHHHHQTPLSPYGNYSNRNNVETMNNNNENRPIFDNLTRSSSAHGLDLSPFLDTNASNTNSFFPSSSPLTDSSSPVSINPIYQPSDIAALLEPTSDNLLTDNSSNSSNALVNDITNTFSSSSSPFALPSSTNLQTSCSTAAAAAASALLQENVLSSLFESFEPFSKYFPVDDPSPSSNSSAKAGRYNSMLTKSPLLTTAPDHSLHPMYYGHS